MSLFSFPDELDATFKLLAQVRERLQSDMNSGLAAKGGYNPVHMQALEKLAVAQAKLGTEIRQWSGHQKSSLDKMPPAQKARIVIQFVQQELPMGARRELYEVLAREEAKRPDGVKFTLGPTPGSAVE